MVRSCSVCILVSSRDILSYCCPLLSVFLLLMALLHPEPPPLASNLMLTRIGSNKMARALCTVRINSAKCDLKDHHESRGGSVPGLATPVGLLKALSRMSPLPADPPSLTCWVFWAWECQTHDFYVTDILLFHQLNTSWSVAVSTLVPGTLAVPSVLLWTFSNMPS